MRDLAAKTAPNLMKFRPASFLKKYKSQNVRKCTLFPTWACLKFPKMYIFSNKSPCGSILTEGTFWKLTSYELIHVCYDRKNWLFLIFWGGNVFPYHDDFCPKTKMVRVVHMKIFYRMDLESGDTKSEFGAKTEKIGRSKNLKFSVGVQNWL